MRAGWEKVGEELRRSHSAQLHTARNFARGAHAPAPNHVAPPPLSGGPSQCLPT